MTSPSSSPPPEGPADPQAATATAELAVAGMHCGSCVALIEEALDRAGRGHLGVGRPRLGPGAVGYDPSLVGLDELRSTIEEAGYSATPVG